MNYLEKWVYRNIRERVTTLDKEGLQELVQKYKDADDNDEGGDSLPISVVFFGNKTNLELYNIFEHLASHEVDHDFYNYPHPGLEQEYGVDFPGYILLKPYDERIISYEGDLRYIDKLKKFIVKNTLKNVFTLGPEDNSQIFTYEVPMIFLYIDHENDEHTAIRENFSEIGNKLGSKVKFAISDYSNHYQRNIAEICGIQESVENTLPQIIIFHTSGMSYNR